MVQEELLFSSGMSIVDGFLGVLLIGSFIEAFTIDASDLSFVGATLAILARLRGGGLPLESRERRLEPTDAECVKLLSLKSCCDAYVLRIFASSRSICKQIKEW